MLWPIFWKSESGGLVVGGGVVGDMVDEGVSVVCMCVLIVGGYE